MVSNEDQAGAHLTSEFFQQCKRGRKCSEQDFKFHSQVLASTQNGDSRGLESRHHVQWLQVDTQGWCPTVIVWSLLAEQQAVFSCCCLRVFCILSFDKALLSGTAYMCSTWCHCMRWVARWQHFRIALWNSTVARWQHFRIALWNNTVARWQHFRVTKPSLKQGVCISEVQNNWFHWIMLVTTASATTSLSALEIFQVWVLGRSQRIG